MAAYEILLLNTAIPQIQAAQSGDTYVVPRDIAFSTVANLANGTNLLPSLTFSSDTNTGIYREGADALGFTAGGGTNQMVLTSTGLGIGTNNPGAKLDVSSTDGVTALVKSTSGTTGNYAQLMLQSFNSFSGVGQAYIRGVSSASGNSNTDLTFGVNASGFGAPYEAMRLDSSGNLGLGVTPSASWSSMRAFQNGTATFANDTGAPRGRLITNAVYNGSNYLFLDASTTYALNYTQDGATGAHQWSTSTAAGTSPNIATLSNLMTLDASGTLLVGATSRLTNESMRIGTNGVQNSLLVGNSSQNNAALIGAFNDAAILGVNRNPSTGVFVNTSNYASDIVLVGSSTNSYIAFETSSSANTAPTERARITSGGYFKASDNGTYSNAGLYHEFYQTANNEALVVRNINASQTSGTLFVQAERNTTNNTFYAIDYYNGGATAYRFRVADSGDVTNTNGTYGTISDAKMKTDIVDAGSQWSDIKALRFRKFKMKNDPSGLVQLGVVAQEVELTSPGLVDEHADKDAEGNDLGTTTKSVKTSVLLMKAAVALQEAMARIEKLEAEVAALKGA